jgi:hypothetical protein
MINTVQKTTAQERTVGAVCLKIEQGWGCASSGRVPTKCEALSPKPRSAKRKRESTVVRKAET